MKNLIETINQKCKECESIMDERYFLAKSFKELNESGGYSALLIFPENGEKCRVTLSKEMTQSMVQPLLKEFNEKLETVKEEMDKFIDGLKLTMGDG